MCTGHCALSTKEKQIARASGVTILPNTTAIIAECARVECAQVVVCPRTNTMRTAVRVTMYCANYVELAADVTALAK